MLTLPQFIGRQTPADVERNRRLDHHPLGGWLIRTDPDMGERSPVIQHDDGSGLDKTEATDVLDWLENNNTPRSE